MVALDILDIEIRFPFERVGITDRDIKCRSFPTLSWTGVHSENRSSVWLLFHLTDKLNIVDYQASLKRWVVDARRQKKSTSSGSGRGGVLPG